MHTEEFIAIPKQIFLRKQTQKIEIIENPRYENKSTQLLLKQQNKLTNEDNVGKADRVLQTNPTTIKQKVGKADKVLQTNPTNFEREEKKKMDSSSYDSEMDPIVTKNS